MRIAVLNAPIKQKKNHSKLFEIAKKAVDNGTDPELDDIQVCLVFGYTLEGEAPDNCPVCRAKKEKFKKN